MPDIFSPTALAKSVHDSIDEAQAAIPEGKSHALILDATIAGGKPDARALYIQRTDAGWDVLLQGEWKGGHDIIGKVGVIHTW